MTILTAPGGATVNVPDEKVDRLLAMGFSTPAATPATDSTSPYKSLNVADLKAEIESRNEGREEADMLSLEGKKADLVATLDADDAASGDE